MWALSLLFKAELQQQKAFIEIYSLLATQRQILLQTQIIHCKCSGDIITALYIACLKRRRSEAGQKEVSRRLEEGKKLGLEEGQKAVRRRLVECQKGVRKS